MMLPVITYKDTTTTTFGELKLGEYYQYGSTYDTRHHVWRKLSCDGEPIAFPVTDTTKTGTRVSKSNTQVVRVRLDCEVGPVIPNMAPLSRLGEGETFMYSNCPCQIRNHMEGYTTFTFLHNGNIMSAVSTTIVACVIVRMEVQE
jgi:hypothetical protein